MASPTYLDFPLLKDYVGQIIKGFKANNNKNRAHELSTPLVAMTHNPAVLREIIRLNIAQPGFFNKLHYPAPNMRVAGTPYFDFVFNCWIPLPDKDTNIRTKALHHHGPMMLSTATAFGPGYEHRMLTYPGPIDRERELFGMDLIEAASHRRHHVSFVDKYIVQLPMYIPSLTITYALWSNSRTTTWRDRLKTMPVMKRKATNRRDIDKKQGATKLLDFRMACKPVPNKRGMIHFFQGLQFTRFRKNEKSGDPYASDLGCSCSITWNHLISSNRKLTESTRRESLPSDVQS